MKNFVSYIIYHMLAFIIFMFIVVCPLFIIYQYIPDKYYLSNIIGILWTIFSLFYIAPRIGTLKKSDEIKKQMNKNERIISFLFFICFIIFAGGFFLSEGQWFCTIAIILIGIFMFYKNFKEIKNLGGKK